VAVEQLEGVRQASFSYERAEGFVTFDSTATTVGRIIEALDARTGYDAMVRTGVESHR